tara:strand:- start:8573 stop:8971 length:399 start_codon:yes stop_codon:yes gene_type:complete
MKLIIKNSDYIGASTSGLCMLHCFATPLIFLSQSAAINISLDITFLWYSLNYMFLLISFIAIYYSVKNSSNFLVKVLLYLFWLLLSALIINEALSIFPVPELYTYISAFSLSSLHIYNLKYCRCDDDECCST